MGRIELNSKLKLTMKRVGVSAAIAAVILIAEYFVGNWLGFLFDDSATLSMIEKILPASTYRDDDDVEYINVGYDKELVDVREQDWESATGWNSKGKAVATDRRKLLKILDIAENSGYRYLFLDVRFEKGLESDMDSMLFSKIKGMKNVVVSTHKEDKEEGGFEIADRGLLAKAGYADYVTTYFSGFTRYSYLQDDSTSVALKMYQDLDGGDLKRVGPFFFSKGRLCNNMQFLTFSENDILASVITPTFGETILKRDNEEDIAERMRGRIVVVGDLVEDVHPTYAGRVAGPVLNFRAYQVLKEGRHIIDIWLVIFLFTVYGGCAYLILYAHTLKMPKSLINRLRRHPLILFILLNAGWGIVMYIVKLVAFYGFKASVIAAIPTFIFSLLSMPDEYSEFRKNNHISEEPKQKLQH